jgi:hypothetical protein
MKYRSYLLQSVAMVTILLPLHLPAAAQSGPSRLLPPSAQSTLWALKAEPKKISGTAIYDYMDGAGEIPIACGYTALAVGEYTRKTGGQITAELYEMSSPADAFGLYSMKRLANGKPIQVGSPAAGAQAQTGYHELLFHRGKYTCLVFADDSGKVTDADLMTIANLISSGIKQPSPLPDLLKMLPAEGVVPRSVKYFHGKAAMDTVKFVRDDVFRLKAHPEVAVATYASGKAMVLRYGSTSEAGMVIASASRASELKAFTLVQSGKLVGAVWSLVGKPADSSLVSRLKRSMSAPGPSAEQSTK